VEQRLISFGVFDTEDNSAELLAAGRSGFEKEMTQGAALTSSGQRFHVGERGQEKLLAWMMARDEKIWYAHNLQYDLGAFFAGALHNLDVVMVGSRLISARFGGKLFLDSYNIWPMALKKLGKAFGIEKLKIDVHDPGYVFRDCEIVLAAMVFAHEFAKRMKARKLPSTLGGFCCEVFRSMGLHNVFDGSLFAREALYGGRVELFSPGGIGNVLYTDINSLYPYAMLGKFPGHAGRQRTMKGYGVADVTVTVPMMDVAPLPWRRDDNAIMFPCGTFRGVWTYHEIENAVAHGAKVDRVHECYGTTKADNYYAPFVDRMYRERLAAETDAEKLMLKLLMNNLYGRLAIRGEITRSKREPHWHLVDVLIPLPEFSNYLHGAYVTSYARVILQDFLRKVEPDRLIYCDTDSIIFWNPDKNPPFPIAKELGQMKLEGVANRARTYGPKVYVFGHHAKAKGIKRSKAVDFIRNGRAEIDQPFKIREAINFFDSGNIRKLAVWRKVQKVRHSEYDKKTLDNGRYFPLILNSTTKHNPKAGKKKGQSNGIRENQRGTAQAGSSRGRNYGVPYRRKPARKG
jgi:hypothetical protein